MYWTDRCHHWEGDKPPQWWHFYPFPIGFCQFRWKQIQSSCFGDTGLPWWSIPVNPKEKWTLRHQSEEAGIYARLCNRLIHACPHYILSARIRKYQWQWIYDPVLQDSFLVTQDFFCILLIFICNTENDWLDILHFLIFSLNMFSR